jgi:nicotinate-nucleotide pyrophosphorylase (carboxylating)
MVDLNALDLTELFDRLTGDGCLDRLIRAAIAEDLGARGDVTTASIAQSNRTTTAAIIARRQGVVAGIRTVVPILKALDAPDIRVMGKSDGEQCNSGETVATITCALQPLLAAERTILNLLGRLCGIATLTRQYIAAVRGTTAVICDTRKTTPGLRNLEKYAVRCGGGTLHRIGLFDAALYKDNHLAGIPLEQLAARLTAAIQSARSAHDLRFVEVEADTLDQLREILRIQPGLIDIVLLDNMTGDQLREAVAMRNAQSQIHNPKSTIPLPFLECSGGVTLDRVRPIAETGVDRISVGAITHSAPSLDIGMDIQA